MTNTAAPTQQKIAVVGQGIAADRIRTISYGKEKPFCTEATESCWAQNRRGVTAITSGAATS